VKANKIVDIGKSVVLKKRYPEEEIVELEGRIAFPGLISTHMHCAQTLYEVRIYMFSAPPLSLACPQNNYILMPYLS
jgi:cytosine/adenosine deaminase-related metal-dependent hydrolase